MERAVSSSGEKGFFLMEVLVVICLFAILGLSIAQSNQTAVRMRGMAVHDSVAMQLAMESLENYASLDPATLNADDNYSDQVTRSGIKFQRTLTVNVNSDTSRTISVAVTGLNSALGGSANVSGTFALWGSQ